MIRWKSFVENWGKGMILEYQFWERAEEVRPRTKNWMWCYVKVKVLHKCWDTEDAVFKVKGREQMYVEKI